jgi:hypothetical protein
MSFGGSKRSPISSPYIGPTDRGRDTDRGPTAPVMDENSDTSGRKPIDPLTETLLGVTGVSGAVKDVNSLLSGGESGDSTDGGKLIDTTGGEAPPAPKAVVTGVQSANDIELEAAAAAQRKGKSRAGTFLSLFGDTSGKSVYRKTLLGS